MALKYSTTDRTNKSTQLITDVGTNAVLNMYTGTRPVSVATALSGNTLLSSNICAATFGTASAGVLTANAIANATAAATGTATFFRLFQTGGTVAVVDGDVAASGSDLNLAGGPGITSGQTVSIASFVITMYGA